LQTGEQLSPTVVGFPVAIFNGHQFRVTRFVNTNDYQQVESVTQADIAVNAIHPPVDIVRRTPSVGQLEGAVKL